MRQIEKLTAAMIRDAKDAGLYGDGGGLYLQVSMFGTKSWIYRYQRGGLRHSHGLGGVTIGDKLSDAASALAGARKRARLVREQLLAGIDPVEENRKKRDAVKIEQSKRLTFRQCAEGYIKAHGAGWRNAKHAGQWQTTLATYVFPVIGTLPVAVIDKAMVLRILEPIWQVKPETASRLRGRLELILDYAAARGYRDGENPARWRGYLDKLLLKPEKVRKPVHHAALPYVELPGFMSELRKQDHIGARALEFCILTATRTSEAISAQWSEIDLPTRTWVIPAARMKGNAEHRVPLCDRAVEILQEIHRVDGAFVFPGRDAGKPVGQSAMLDLLRRAMRRPGVTVHGFRSTFRDWAAERTNYQNHILEMALAHKIGNAAEAAYRQGDLMEKRARLMNDWARYCASTPAVGEVVPLRRA
jgi:integrase